jgi:hypothetical protein
MTFHEEMRAIANKYMRSGRPWPATAEQIARWAIDNKLWAPQARSLVRLCAEQLSDAMHLEYFTDPQGRRVRAKHCARITQRGKQLTLWADIRSAPHRHMEVAFQQRRQQVLGDCHQLKIDVDSYNQNRNPEKPIQMSFDFTKDLQEAEVDMADRA